MHCSLKFSAHSRPDMNMMNRPAVFNSIPWFPLDLGLHLFDTPLHPDAGRDLIFKLFFFYHVAVFIPVMPDLHLETLHNHTLGIDKCMVAFFFFLFPSSFCLLYINSTSNHPLSGLICLSWPRWRSSTHLQHFHFLRMYSISDFKPAPPFENREPTSINCQRQFWILAFRLCCKNNSSSTLICLTCKKLVFYGL